MNFIDILRKLGIFRSGSVSAKYTSGKDRPTEFLMDDVYNAKEDLTTKKDLKKVFSAITASSQGDDKKVGVGRKIFFWVVVIFGTLFFLAFISSGFSFRFLVFIILWAGLIWKLKKFAFQGFYSMWMIMVLSSIIFFVTLMIFPSSDKSGSFSNKNEGLELEDANISKNENSLEEKCDDSNSEYADFNQKEKIIVSKNPCKVPWILAKAYERYDLKTKKGTNLKVVVWNNYVNSVEAGESYTIRVLDVEDGGVVGKTDIKAGISIVRWVPNKKALSEAKKEVEELVKNLEY